MIISAYSEFPIATAVTKLAAPLVTHLLVRISEKSFVGSRAVPYHDAELITYNYNPAIRKGASS